MLALTPPSVKPLVVLFGRANSDTGSPPVAWYAVLEDCQVFAVPGNKMSTAAALQNGVPADGFCIAVLLWRFRYRSPPLSYFLTASFSAFAAVNLGALVAGILIGLPVLGLTP